MAKLFVDSVLDGVQVNRICFLFQIVFVWGELLLIEIRSDLKFLQLSCSQFELPFNLLRLFLILDDLLLETVDCLGVSFDIEVLKTLDCF